MGERASGPVLTSVFFLFLTIVQGGKGDDSQVTILLLNLNKFIHSRKNSFIHSFHLTFSPERPSIRLVALDILCLHASASAISFIFSKLAASNSA